MTKADTPLLEIENLTVEFDTASGNLKAVDGVSLSVHEREVLAIVGESGSGKSVSMLAVMGLLPWTARVTADALRFQGRDISNLTSSERRKLVGKDVAMIFQEPIASLNPCFTVGFQIDETLREHTKLNKRERRDRTIELFEAVGLPNPEDRLSAYPHQMSGGQCQRVMIAMAIACDPKLLIADEPTTALDVTIQKQILDLLVDLQAEKNMGMIMITHDMGVVAETADRVIVKYKGRKMEEADVLSLFENPQNSYTKALLSALPENATGDRLPTVTDLTFEQQANPEASA
ncbi:MAG: ABC transporter ATP-binding protein [Rhizobiaceae bacterium]|nr:ABC transporter ATP-binding protein [Rhizobiaceae bacterium]